MQTTVFKNSIIKTHNLKSILATLRGNPSFITVVPLWLPRSSLRLIWTLRLYLTNNMGTIILQMHTRGHWFWRVIWKRGRGGNNFTFFLHVGNIGFNPFSSMRGLNKWMHRGNLNISIYRWWREWWQIGPTTMVRDFQIDNLLPSIIRRDF